MTQKKILIADDDREVVEVLKARLEVSGYETLVAYEGIRVMEIAHKKSPNLIILDLRMPAGTGQSVLKNLRSYQDTAKIPVIILTALKEPHLKEELLAAGAQDFMEKPYEADQLLEKIRLCLEKNEGTS